MKLVQLEYFCAVCRYHSITRAAEELYVTQPTISVAIRELEKELKTRLFHHEKNRISLTREGEACSMVQAEDLDAALVNMDFYNIDQFNSQVLMEDSYVYCVGRSHRYAREKEITFEMLGDEKIILFNTDSVQNETVRSRLFFLSRLAILKHRPVTRYVFSGTAMGGNLSLIGAPGNMIAQSALEPLGLKFGFFEYAIVGLPIHGSAPDIAGTQTANPLAAIWSASQLLDFFGHEDLGKRILDTMEIMLSDHQESLTPDQGGSATTSACGDAFVKLLEA